MNLENAADAGLGRKARPGKKARGKKARGKKARGKDAPGDDDFRHPVAVIRN